MRAYHATNVRFEKFDNNFLASRDEGFFGRGFYFVDEMHDAKDIQDQLDARYLVACKVTDNVYELDLNDQELAIKMFPAPEEIKNEWLDILDCDGKFFGMNSEGVHFEKYLKEAGFDGVKILNRLADVGNGNYTEIVVFDAEDIEIEEIEDCEDENESRRIKRDN